MGGLKSDFHSKVGMLKSEASAKADFVSVATEVFHSKVGRLKSEASAKTDFVSMPVHRAYMGNYNWSYNSFVINYYGVGFRINASLQNIHPKLQLEL